jgi:hypothetical protein
MVRISIKKRGQNVILVNQISCLISNIFLCLKRLFLLPFLQSTAVRNMIIPSDDSSAVDQHKS